MRTTRYKCGCTVTEDMHGSRPIIEMNFCGDHMSQREVQELYERLKIKMKVLTNE